MGEQDSKDAVMAGAGVDPDAPMRAGPPGSAPNTNPAVRIALRGVGTCEERAHVVEFLIADLWGRATGAVIPIDSGLPR